MALEQFTPQKNTSLYAPIDVGKSPYYDTATQQQTPQATLPVYQAPKFQTGNESFSFDPNLYLPGIQQQAKAIYQPQVAQLEALRQLQGSQAETARIVTKEDFAKKMQGDIEAINQRGAFFSGGSINKQQETNTAEQRALGDITTSWNAANFSNIAQQAGLSASQAEYIQNQLSGAQGSAYNMFSNERSAFQAERSYQQQLKDAEAERKSREKQLKAQGKSSKEAKKKAEKEFNESKRRWEAEFNKPKTYAPKKTKTIQKDDARSPL
jgi:hypothetical protein